MDNTLNITVEEIDVIITKEGMRAPENESDEAGVEDRDIRNVIESSGMGRPNRDLDVTTEWTIFPAPALYDDDDGGESNVMICQGLWFDRRASEDGAIDDRYACDGWLPGVSGSTGPILGAVACSFHAMESI